MKSSLYTKSMQQFYDQNRPAQSQIRERQKSEFAAVVDEHLEYSKQTMAESQRILQESLLKLDNAKHRKRINPKDLSYTQIDDQLKGRVRSQKSWGNSVQTYQTANIQGGDPVSAQASMMRTQLAD